MKRLSLIVLFIALMFVAVGEEDVASALKTKHEETVLSSMRMLTRFGCDDINLYSRPEYAQRTTNAWSMLEHFDGGWFTKCKSKTISNLRTDHWTYVSDTEFCVDAYCDFTCDYTYAVKKETFHCAYHFCFHQTNAQKDEWQFYDFHNIALDSEAEYAQSISDANEGITVLPITGNSYIGYMAIVDDPSRVTVGTIDTFGSKVKGMRIDALVKKYNAVGGINGGGFSDGGGTGSGGEPFGLIISGGKKLRGHTPNGEASSVVIGFDEDDKLIVGKFSSVDSLRLRDAMAFNYALVLEGQNVATGYKNVSRTTRTAIGQDTDGRVLILVIQGRQPNSLGATYNDLAEIMLKFGAVNAANLDGGTSTCFYLNGSSVYSGYRLDCSRSIPAAFLIMPASK